MNRTKLLGKSAEVIARRYLLSRGYKILENNFKTRYGEIDIICKKRKTYIFVEVKARKSKKHGPPELAVTKKKISNIKTVSSIYCTLKNISNVKKRIEIVSIYLSKSKLSKIKLIKVAYNDIN